MTDITRKLQTKNQKENIYETDAARHIADSYGTKTKQSHNRFALHILLCAFPKHPSGHSGASSNASQSAYECSWQPSSAIAGPSLLAGVCNRATRSILFPTPQGFKWGICHSTGNGSRKECYSAGRNRQRTAPNAVAFTPSHGERNSRAGVPVPRHSHRGSLATK